MPEDFDFIVPLDDTQYPFTEDERLEQEENEDYEGLFDPEWECD